MCGCVCGGGGVQRVGGLGEVLSRRASCVDVWRSDELATNECVSVRCTTAGHVLWGSFGKCPQLPCFASRQRPPLILRPRQYGSIYS
eukprot:316853-Chlamydomonas_euryale.AAC.1